MYPPFNKVKLFPGSNLRNKGGESILAKSFQLASEECVEQTQDNFDCSRSHKQTLYWSGIQLLTATSRVHESLLLCLSRNIN